MSLDIKKIQEVLEQLDPTNPVIKEMNLKKIKEAGEFNPPAGQEEIETLVGYLGQAQIREFATAISIPLVIPKSERQRKENSTLISGEV